MKPNTVYNMVRQSKILLGITKLLYRQTRGAGWWLVFLLFLCVCVGGGCQQGIMGDPQNGINMID